uniref:Tyr recombinase domain-containing protein n=1 Tax=Racemicystis crocea TaxID=1707966 RepID=A0A3S7V0N7_9BACT|nr:hypothetical protein [Racemicystis crocea]
MSETARKGYGQGSITPVASGFWVRLSINGKRQSLGIYPTEEEAEEVRIAALRELTAAGRAPTGGMSLRAWGERWLADREADGVRDVRTDRSRWANHIDTAPFADDPMSSITPPLINAWVRKLQKKTIATPRHKARPISRKTIREIVMLLRSAFDAAIREGIAHENPVTAIKVRPEAKTHEPWTYLLPEEQSALLQCEVIPEADRLIIAFAIGSGLRQGEQFNLELSDLRIDGPNPEITVRYGSKKRATKTSKIRRVPLFGLALDAAKRWIHLLPSYAPKNPEGLVFPTPGGGRRPKGKHLHKSVWRNGKVQKLDVFREHLKAASIIAAKRHDGRPVRWHDLRHTCGSSLVAGWWGHPWRFEEVKEILGHTSIAMTQRYAHLAPSHIQALAKRTPGGSGAGEGSAGPAAGRGAAPPSGAAASPASVGASISDAAPAPASVGASISDGAATSNAPPSGDKGAASTPPAAPPSGQASGAGDREAAASTAPVEPPPAEGNWLGTGYKSNGAAFAAPDSSMISLGGSTGTRTLDLRVKRTKHELSKTPLFPSTFRNLGHGSSPGGMTLYDGEKRAGTGWDGQHLGNRERGWGSLGAELQEGGGYAGSTSSVLKSYSLPLDPAISRNALRFHGLMPSGPSP